MKAFLGTTLGKVVIGVLAVAVVAGGGYGIYQAVQSDPAPIPEVTTDATTTEAPITTLTETTTEEEITEAPTEAPTDAPTAAPTAATTTTKATTTTSTTKATTTTTTTKTDAPANADSRKPYPLKGASQTIYFDPIPTPAGYKTGDWYVYNGKAVTDNWPDLYPFMGMLAFPNDDETSFGGTFEIPKGTMLWISG